MTSYTTGLEAVKANLDAMAQQGTGQWLNDLYWDGKKTPQENKRFVRFLTDAVISVAIHEYIPTLNGKKMDFICAQALATPRECFICDNIQVTADDGTLVPAKPRTLTFGLVCLRNEEFHEVDGRRKPFYTDVEVEIDKEGKKVKVRDYRIVRQSQKTFWANLHGYFARYGTIIDRDYEISRTGATGSNTIYTILPCDEVEDLVTKEQVDKRYDDVPETIVQYIERLGSESRYNKFLIKGPEASDAKTGDKPAQSAPEGESTGDQPAAQPQGNQTSFGSLKDKLMDYNKGKDGEKAEAASS